MKHELTEAGLMDQGMSYEDAHAQALKLHPFGRNYDPDLVDKFGSFGPAYRKAWGLGPRSGPALDDNGKPFRVGGMSTLADSKFLRGASFSMKYGGRALLGLAVAYDIYDVASAPDGQKAKTAVNDGASLAGGLAGATYGAEFGAEIGSFGGPVGTVVGGVVGGIAGGFVGSGAASSVVSGIEDLF